MLHQLGWVWLIYLHISIVELASCQWYMINCGTGILPVVLQVELASCQWYMINCGTGILPVVLQLVELASYQWFYNLWNWHLASGI
ncbi:hypothetical protein [Moorena sp. SIOASIH]|uniref:hypothetical protein n=1 Tax=Moorena sp. SIOASIH TaxID=2607817 RepID=UPI0025D88AA7|nr:hypothetical protein [Moorena sp. SIOASIH]